MIGSKFELNKKTYVLVKEETKGYCDGCVFDGIYKDEDNLCSLVYSENTQSDRNLMCQSFDAIFVETPTEVVKGVKKKLLL